MSPLISIVVPVYNRRDSIVHAIDSIFACFVNKYDDIEIIVVDDCSVDDSFHVLQITYSQYIKNNKMSIVRLAENKGVGGARNLGVKLSKGKWVLFFDSDDKLIPNMGLSIFDQLSESDSCPVVFFRCLNEKKEKVGTSFSDIKQYIQLSEFLVHGSYGECLVAIERNCIVTEPFAENLRGYEGLTIARILKASQASALLSPIIARIYDQSGDDRLSSRMVFLKRMPLIAQGHLTMVKEFKKEMGFRLLMKYISRALVYLCIGKLYNSVIQR